MTVIYENSHESSHLQLLELNAILEFDVELNYLIKYTLILFEYKNAFFIYKNISSIQDEYLLLLLALCCN